MTDLFKALSEESRLRILSMLLHTDLCVCEIVECLQLKQSNISRHLAALKNSGILGNYKTAQWIYYNINEEFIEEHALLWQYLEKKLQEIPSYQSDYSRLQSCKRESICNAENAEDLNISNNISRKSASLSFMNPSQTMKSADYNK